MITIQRGAGSSGGGASLNGITAATGAVTIASGNNTGIVWNWANTSNTTVAFTFGETSAATNGTTSASGVPNQVLLKLATLASSTQSPLAVYSRGSFVFAVSATAKKIILASGNGLTIAGGTDTTGGIGESAGQQFSWYANNAIVFSSINGGIQLASGQAIVTGTSTAAAPSITTDGGFSTGIFGPSSNVVGITANGIELLRWSAGVEQFSFATAAATSFAINARKSRGTVAAPTVITTGDNLLTISGYGYLGATNTYREAARLTFASAGTISDATNGIGSVVTLSGTTQGTDTAPQPTIVVTGGSTATIKFAGTGMFTANGSTLWAVGSNCPGNATVQEWLTIVDSAGNTRYIPCF